MNDNLVEKFNNKIHENWQFTISELLACFPLISHTLLHEIVANYHEICARLVPTMLLDERETEKKKKHGALSLTNLQQYNNKAQKFLDHSVTGDETWISYSNVKMRKQIHGLEA